MAGILLLQERSLDAVEKYREALCFVSQYDKEAFIKVDKLQQIHTLYNLNEVLSNKSYPTPPPTLRDETLKQDLELLQCKYMDKYIVEVHSSMHARQWLLLNLHIFLLDLCCSGRCQKCYQ